MAKRRAIPNEIQDTVLIRSRRRCCMCCHLNEDRVVKSGQICHLDGDPSNNVEDNLVFLCMQHHGEYDSRSRTAKGLTGGEVKHARRVLYEALSRDPKRQLVEITLNQSFSTLTPQIQETVLDDITRSLHLDREIHVIHKRPGSVRLILEVGAEDAVLLVNSAKAGDLARLGVVDARVVESHEPLLETGKLKVFICYARQDKPKAREIFDRLAAAGADPWLDEQKLVIGDEWKLKIRKALKEADAAVVCLSPQFDQIGFRQQELRWAKEFGEQRPLGEAFILPFMIEATELPSWCEGIHVGDPWKPTSCDELLQALQEQFPHWHPKCSVSAPVAVLLPAEAPPIPPLEDLAQSLASCWSQGDEDRLEEVCEQIVERISDEIGTLERRRAQSAAEGLPDEGDKVKECESEIEDLKGLRFRIRWLPSPDRHPESVNCIEAWLSVKDSRELRDIEGFLDKHGRGRSNLFARLGQDAALPLWARRQRRCAAWGAIAGLTLGLLGGLAVGWIGAFIVGAPWYWTVALFVVVGALAGLALEEPGVGAVVGAIVGGVAVWLGIVDWPAHLLGPVGRALGFSENAVLMGGVAILGTLGALVGLNRGIARGKEIAVT